MTALRLGSLFDGIGVFPLAAVRCGIEPVWASEIEKAPISITKRHFPDMTACFSEYSRKVLDKAKSRQPTIPEQMKQAEQQLAKEKPPKENRAPAKSQDFVGRGETTERADFGHEMAEGAERSLVRRKEVSHDR